MNFIRALAASIFLACLANDALAQTYPDRPVTMLVAFPPGGADDATARIIQDPMQKALGQPIVIENLGGAGGMINASAWPSLGSDFPRRRIILVWRFSL
jgi:tripartite-type tricarboxylate transporter receptor subunit TctC